MIDENTLVSKLNAHQADAKSAIFEDSTTFSQYIETRAIDEGATCMSLILDFCEKKSLDIEDITDLLSKPLKEKLKEEMYVSGMMPRTESNLDSFDE